MSDSESCKNRCRSIPSAEMSVMTRAYGSERQLGGDITGTSELRHSSLRFNREVKSFEETVP